MNQPLFHYLKEKANAKTLVSYTEAGNIVGLHPGDPGLWEMLGDISRDTQCTHSRMLSAIVISQGERSSHKGYPGNEFFQLAHHLGRTELKTLGTVPFWVKEIEGVFAITW